MSDLLYYTVQYLILYQQLCQISRKSKALHFHELLHSFMNQCAWVISQNVSRLKIILANRQRPLISLKSMYWQRSYQPFTYHNRIIKMSFKADFEIILHLRDFLNVDLPSQGLFRLRASIFQQQKQKDGQSVNITYANPFEFSQPLKPPARNLKKLFFPHDHDIRYFYSKVGSVRYSDERIVLDDMIRFKLEIESFPRLHSENIFLEIDLLFSPCFYASQNKQFQGKKVSTCKFRLEGLEHGLLNYCQGQFQEDHISKFSFTIFGCLANFKFGKFWLPEEEHKLKVSEETPQKSEEKQIITKERELKRMQVKTFEEFFSWISQFYGKKIPDPGQYFYHTYVKNLRYYFYLIQQKVKRKSTKQRKVILKVSKQFIQLPQPKEEKEQQADLPSISEQVFKKYMADFQPEQIKEQSIREELNEIYMDIFYFLIEMEKAFVEEEFSVGLMQKEYATYIKERYGERVFKSIVYGKNNALTSEQNKKIAKKMREKQEKTSTASYPVEDLAFVLQKQLLEFVFYEVCYPQMKKPTLRFSDPADNSDEIKIDERYSYEVEGSNSVKESIDEIDKKQYEIFCEEKGENIWQNSESSLGSAIEVKINQSGREKMKGEIFEDSQVDSSRHYADYRSDMSEKGYGSDQCEDGQIKIGNILSEINEEVSLPTEETQLPQIEYDQRNMLVVMCHGYQGSQYDMIILLRSLKEVLPLANYMLSKVNEAETDGNIDDMGERLAKEIEAYIHHYLDPEKVIINFLGHSMGGVIARSSLKHLQPNYENQFGFFCSLSSPHLGYLNGVDNMIKAGLWVIRKFKPAIQSLNQLSMEDNRNRRSTFMYRLSSNGTLRKFRKIILLSSYEDSYVAWHSARISKTQSNRTSQARAVEQEMVQNILGDRPVHRIDVNFQVRTKDLDSLIGRTAHINLIMQTSLFRIINATLPDLFDITKP